MTLSNSQAGLFAALAYQAQNVAHGFTVGPEAVVRDAQAFRALLDEMDSERPADAPAAPPVPQTFTPSPAPVQTPTEALQQRADYHRDNAADIFAESLYNKDGIWYSRATDNPVVFTPYGYIEETETASSLPSSQSSQQSSPPLQSSPSSPADTSSTTIDSPASNTAPNTAALSAVTPPQ